MPLTLTWHDILLRLALSVFAGALMGVDRSEHGRPAGLRTTLLVCLAAAVAMIQTNLLMLTVGKASDSFVVLDLMRLPLGILTGMGFIGGGAIHHCCDALVRHCHRPVFRRRTDFSGNSSTCFGNARAIGSPAA